MFKKAASGEKVRKVESVTGSQGEDNLTPDKGGAAFGEGGDDALHSAKGAVMRGDGGADSLYGDNGGNDVFWLQNLDATGDQLYKFSGGQDNLRIDGSAFGLGGSLDGNELVNDSNGHDATEAQAQLIYDQASGTLWLDADGTGGQAAIRIASFNGGAPARCLPGTSTSFRAKRPVGGTGSRTPRSGLHGRAFRGSNTPSGRDPQIRPNGTS